VAPDHSFVADGGRRTVAEKLPPNGAEPGRPSGGTGSWNYAVLAIDSRAGLQAAYIFALKRPFGLRFDDDKCRPNRFAARSMLK
jgi:hypothetical protein